MAQAAVRCCGECSLRKLLLTRLVMVKPRSQETTSARLRTCESANVVSAKVRKLEVAQSTVNDQQVVVDVIQSAKRLAKSISHTGLGSIEVRFDPSRPESCLSEVNPWLQVEHTIT